MLYNLRAKKTVTPIEVDCGDVIHYTLASGFTNQLEILHCSAKVVETNKQDLNDDWPEGGTILKLICTAKVNGLDACFVKYIGCQESFSQPYLINGMHLWLDNAKCLFDVIPENHGECRAQKDVRLVLHDGSLPICPQEISDWCDMYGKDYIDIGECYNGDDCYLGAYNGSAAHGGLDINHPKGTAIYAPIDFDDQCYFHSLPCGDVNNRWKAVRHWDSDSAWVLQVHHIGGLTIEEHTSVARGTQVAEGALVHLGCHAHSHFVFRAYERGEEYVLDPWILFRQILINKRKHRLHGAIQHQNRIITGERAAFTGISNKPDTTFLWRISDGTSYYGESINHIFTNPGIYAVELSTFTQDESDYTLEYVSVNGNAISTPRMLVCIQDRGFCQKQLPYTPNYGFQQDLLNVMDLAFHRNYQGTVVRDFTIVKSGPIPLDVKEIEVVSSTDAIQAAVSKKAENEIVVRVCADAARLSEGQLIRLDLRSALINGCQTIWLKVRLAEQSHDPAIICSCKSRDFYLEGYSFVGHKFVNWFGSRGYEQFYLTDGGEKNSNAKAVFRPVLSAGRYQLEFMEHELLERNCLIAVKVTDVDGDHEVKVNPRESLIIGTFTFSEGNGGRVELISCQSTGIVLADAIKFVRIK